MKMIDENKAKALAAALAQIEKQFGKGSIMKLGDKGIGEDIPVVSTGSLTDCSHSQTHLSGRESDRRFSALGLGEAGSRSGSSCR